MPNKSSYNQFMSSWNKTVNWANDNHIPSSAYMPVYQMDSQRFLANGYGMSEGDRLLALQAAAGLSAPTQLPQDHPGPSDVLANTKTNLQQIFTGLIGAPAQLYDTLKNTIAHPSTVYDIGYRGGAQSGGVGLRGPGTSTSSWQGNVANFADVVQSPHDIWSLVPGFSDVAQALQGKQGLSRLAQSPISALLDVLPLSRLPPEALAGQATADSARLDAQLAAKGVPHDELQALTLSQKATRLGLDAHSPGLTLGTRAALLAHLDPEELAGMSTGQLSWHLSKSSTFRKAPIAPVHLPDGTVTSRQLTNGERISAYRNLKGLGSEQGQITKEITTASEEVTAEVERQAEPAITALGKLSPEDSRAIYTMLEKDTRPESEIVSDPSLTPLQSDAIEKVFSYAHWSQDYKLNSGDLVSIATPFGNEIYSNGPNSAATPVLRAKAKVDSLQSTLDKASTRADELTTAQLSADANISDGITQIANLRDTLNQYLTAAPDNLSNLLGIPDEQIHAVRGGSPTRAAFTGLQEHWSDTEKLAYESARRGTPMSEATRAYYEHPADYEPWANKVPRDEAIKIAKTRLHQLNMLERRTIKGRIPRKQLLTISRMFADGGLLDQIDHAYQTQNWSELRDISEVAARTFNTTSLAHAAPQLETMRGLINGLRGFSRDRLKTMDELTKLVEGKDSSGRRIQSGKYSYKNSIAHHTTLLNKALANYTRESTNHPPMVWKSLLLDAYTKKLLEHKEGKLVLDAAAAKRAGEDKTYHSILTSDPRLLTEAITAAAKATEANGMLPDFDIAISNQVKQSAYDEIALLRARGQTPHYVATVSPFNRLNGEGDAIFNTYIGIDRIPTVDSAFERSMDFGSSIHDIQASILKDTKQLLQRDATVEIVDHLTNKYAFSRESLLPILQNYLKEQVSRVSGEDRELTVEALYEEQLSKWNLVAYEPQKMFGVSLPRFSGKSMYIDKSLLDSMQKSVDRYQRPDTMLYDRATNLFRTSILGYSPRFTAHIAFGGGAMLAARSTLHSVKYIPDAWRAAKLGRLPDDIVAGMPTRVHSEVLQHSAQEEGAERIVLHQALKHSLHQFVLQEKIANRFGIMPDHPDWFTHYLKIIPEANFALTRRLQKMQRALAFMDGAHEAAKSGHFFEDALEPESGQVVRVRHEMTPERAMDQGLQHVHSVMGDLRSMTPLERVAFTRVFPFWGWTTHVLKYVMSYPVDHPYRAVFLGQLAEQSSQNVASGLPLRIQLLFFLGHPNSMGEASAIDIRALDPLRDTENYASMAGWLGALNPVYTAAMSTVDPNITFGNNVAYPNMTYNSLYGVKEASAAGSPWNAAEQFVPELTALDAAFNLSGQYAYLQSSGQHNALYHKLYESLNIPFLQTQHVNLRQIAAQDELDRVAQAKAAAQSAWTSGDFSQLAGYNMVPDPRNAVYQITPAALEAVYNQYANEAAGTGLTPADIALPLQTPSSV